MTFTATLKFASREAAKSFASKWASYSLRGHDMSSTHPDGTCTVKIYHVTEADKEWIANATRD